jgi:hypothetical protein
MSFVIYGAFGLFLGLRGSNMAWALGSAVVVATAIVAGFLSQAAPWGFALGFVGSIACFNLGLVTALAIRGAGVKRQRLAAGMLSRASDR